MLVRYELVPVLIVLVIKHNVCKPTADSLYYLVGTHHLDHMNLALHMNDFRTNHAKKSRSPKHFLMNNRP